MNKLKEAPRNKRHGNITVQKPSALIRYNLTTLEEVQAAIEERMLIKRERRRSLISLIDQYIDV